ncbi:hypothetical protein J7K28_07385 [Candidatus Aerophobetes bacterium]|nr:hypothetical protein [Candidatus Aerophobetes bacterium]
MFSKCVRASLPGDLFQGIKKFIKIASIHNLKIEKEESGYAKFLRGNIRMGKSGVDP